MYVHPSNPARVKKREAQSCIKIWSLCISTKLVEHRTSIHPSTHPSISRPTLNSPNNMPALLIAMATYTRQSQLTVKIWCLHSKVSKSRPFASISSVQAYDNDWTKPRIYPDNSWIIMYKSSFALFLAGFIIYLFFFARLQNLKLHKYLKPYNCREQ